MAETANPGLQQLAKAYVDAWSEIGSVVQKDANNPHFGNDYATLEAVLKLVKPVLAKYSLAFLQSPGEMRPCGTGDVLTISGVLMHSSGELLTINTQVPIGPKATAQAAGSGFTYARRYQLMAVFGLAPTDDDGQEASEPAPEPKKRAKKEKTESYAAGADALIAEIEAFTGTADEMQEQLRPRVEELGDAKVNEAYVTKRRSLKKGK